MNEAINADIVLMQVILNANLVRANQTCLELELEKSDSPPIILPVLYNAMVPKITPAPDIRLRACFLDFTYVSEIQIVSNEFWGYFVVENTPNVMYYLYLTSFYFTLSQYF